MKSAQEFLDWYTPIAAEQNAGPSYWRALNHNPPYLTHALTVLLRADSVERRASNDVGAGINFDPFLATQDPCGRYQAKEARHDTHGYVVMVQPMCSDPRWQPSPHRLTLVGVNGRFVIADVSHGSTSIVELLCSVRSRANMPACRK
jgi:hypothetical protein